MPIRPTAALAFAGLVAAASPAAAQLGSAPNVPRQNLYHFAPQKRLDTGLGARAETHVPSATTGRATRRIVRRHGAGN